MHTAHNYRHSRRSACDRCRGQKLRCERAHMNGMSCERCLKAQEMCITSVNRPAPAILHSNHDQKFLSHQHESSRFKENRDSMSLLHKSFGSKVKKPLHSPSTIIGRYNNKVHGYWGESTAFPLLSGDKFLPSPDANGVNMSLHFENVPAALEPWGDQHLYWPTGAHNSGPFEYTSAEQIGYYEDQNVSSSALMCDFSLEAKSDPQTAIQPPLQDLSLDYTGLESFAALKSVSNFDRTNYPGLATIEEPLPSPFHQESPPSQQNIRKSLLKLKVGLLEDLDLLGGSNPIGSSFFASGHGDTSIEALNLPIYRLLDHSSWLLDIVQSFRGRTGTTEVNPYLTPSTQPSQFQNCRSEDSTIHHSDAGDNGSDESVTTISSLDWGYQTTMTSPNHATPLTSQRYDITLWLSVLEAHCYLARIYRAVFTRLYQLFLIIPPADAATFLLLPKFQYGQYQLDSNLTAQVRVLVEIGSTMMGNIETALGSRSAPHQVEDDGESSRVETICENNWSTSIREFVFAQEQDACEMPLAEIMKCLRQLVRDPVIT